MGPLRRWISERVVITVIGKYVVDSSDTASCKVCNFLWWDLFLVVPENNPGTHEIGDLRSHDRTQNDEINERCSIVGDPTTEGAEIVTILTGE